MTNNELTAHDKAFAATADLRAKRDESFRLHYVDSVAYDRTYTAFYVDELALLEFEEDDE
jgi:hypothetical protein